MAQGNRKPNRKRGTNARRKGAAGEREAAKLIGGVRTSRVGEASADVTGPDGIEYEVKRRVGEFAKLYQYLDQTKDVRRLLVRDDRKPWLVIMYAEDFDFGRKEDP